MCPKRTEYNVFKAVSATPYSSVRQFRPAVFKELKSGWIIEFYAFNPAVGKLCRKRANVNKISGKSARRTYALSLVSDINEKLFRGWNPFVSDSNSSNLTLFCDAVNLTASEEGGIWVRLARCEDKWKACADTAPSTPKCCASS